MLRDGEAGDVALLDVLADAAKRQLDERVEFGLRYQTVEVTDVHGLVLHYLAGLPPYDGAALAAGAFDFATDDAEQVTMLDSDTFPAVLLVAEQRSARASNVY